GKTVGVAANENKFARSAVAKFAEPFRKGVRVEIFPERIQQDCGGGAVGIKPLESCFAVANFCDLDGRVAADALHVIVDHRTQFRAARFAEHEQADFNFKPYFLGFSSRVLRLMPRASAARLMR